MYGRLAAYLQWRADLLVAERFEDLARESLFPFVMYQGEQQLIVGCVDRLSQVYAQVRAEQKQRQVARLQAELVALDLPRHGRFRAWASFHELDGQSRRLSRCDVVYYCRDLPQGMRTEMAEFGQCVLPQLWSDQAQLIA